MQKSLGNRLRNRAAWLLSLFATVLLAGCEKDIDIKLNEEAPKLVVEATIENGTAPVVVLTQSFAYFSKISLDQLSQSFVRGAEVFVSNGSKTHKLKEYAVPLGGGFFFRYYSTDSANLATAFVGELNTAYSLRIVTGGQTYTANTSIPRITKRIDSLYWRPGPPQLDSNKVIVLLRAYDPPGFGDYVRYFTRRNREPFLPGINSAFDDLFVDGTSYEVSVQAGVDRNRDLKEEDFFFNKGDTVTFKLSNIDKATFDFWRTIESSYQSIGNPFSTPTKVLGNISNNALGYFGGYASQYRTLVIKK